MDPATLNGFLDFVNKAGVLGLLAAILLGGYKGWWVWGWQYRDVAKDRDEWKTIALRAAHLTTRLADQSLPPDKSSLE